MNVTVPIDFLAFVACMALAALISVFFDKDDGLDDNKNRKPVRKSVHPTSMREAFNLLIGERNYQDDICAEEWAHKGFPPVGAELMMMRIYHNDAMATWTNTWGDPGEAAAMDVLRKVGGMALRAIEHHGCLRNGEYDPATMRVPKPETSEARDRTPHGARLTREQAFEIVVGERDAQQRMWPYVPSMATEFALVDEYIDRARKSYADGFGPETMENMRAITAIVLRAIENYGCPERE